MITRRSFITAGIVGTAALATAGLWSWTRHRAHPASVALDEDAQAIVAAIVPAMLGPAVPGSGSARAAAIRATVSGVDRAVAGLPPAARAEIGQLFALLSIPVARRAFAGVASDWHEATPDEVDAFLERWRDSGWALKRTAYDALHQLVMAAWYAQPESWAAIGYPGPPSLG